MRETLNHGLDSTDYTMKPVTGLLAFRFSYFLGHGMLTFVQVLPPKNTSGATVSSAITSFVALSALRVHTFHVFNGVSARFLFKRLLLHLPL